MAKGRHAKDKLYLTPSERKETGFGFQGNNESGRMHFIAFNSCCLSMQEAKTPVITPDGDIFDYEYIKAFVKKYGKHPITGEELKLKSLRPVRFHRNDAGEVICPITHRVFNHHSHIVMNLKSGHVYSKEAIDEVCRGLNLWEDPITSVPFDRQTELIDLQNPSIPPKRIESKIFFENRELILNVEGEVAKGGTSEHAITDKPSVVLCAQAQKVKNIMAENADTGLLAQKRKLGLSRRDTTKQAAASVTSGLHSTGAMAASFTSTAADLTYSNTMRQLSDEEIRSKMYREVKMKRAKGYARLRTSLGNLSMQLHCDIAPRACHSFIMHAENGYFDKHLFHRILPRFVFQTGDPTGTGKGGESAFPGGESFKDELDPSLNHVGSGVVGMANNGPFTNGSQFYITFASCPHLDKKHTIFGNIVGGKDVIEKFSKVKQKGGKPENPPLLMSVEVFKNPFKETEFAKKLAAEEAELVDIAKNEGGENLEDVTKKRPREEDIEAQLIAETSISFGQNDRRNLASTVHEAKKHRKEGKQR